MTHAERPQDDTRLAYDSPALEHLGSLVEITKTDLMQNVTSDGSGYAPGQPGGS